MKIHLLTCLILLSTVFAVKAQYVTIPDAQFVTWLNNNGFSQCMNGNQMDTTCNAVVTAGNINCLSSNINSLEGIQYFDGLRFLNCSFNNLTTLPNLPVGLWDLNCYENSIATLPPLPPTLQLLQCQANNLTQLGALPSTLADLNITDNNISVLPTLPANLLSLKLSLNPISVLPSTLPSSLHTLEVDSTNITSIPNLPSSLLTLEVGNNPIGVLPALPSGLLALGAINTGISYLPQIPDTMNSLAVDSNPNLTCLPKWKHIVVLTFTNTGITCLPVYGSVGIHNPQIGTLPLCQPFNNNNCTVYTNVSGTVFLDTNTNCSLNAGESLYGNVGVKLFNNGVYEQTALTNAQGIFTLYGEPASTYQVLLDTANLPFTVTCPPTGYYTNNIATVDSFFYSNDFALRCKTGFDLAAHSISTGQIFRPANNTTVNIQAGDLANFYHANCAHAVAGAITVTINGPATYIAPANGAITPSSVSGNVITWNVADFGTTDALNDFNIVVRTDTFAQIGQQVCFTVSVTPTVGDRDTANNTLTHCFSIVNSYDPNDKTAYPSGDIDTAQEWLTYRVRFQNTGNAEAQHIYIMDTLESGLDVSTFQLLAYSHQPNVQINENIVRFNFPNINLPDSFTNEPGSHGYVQYKVRLKEDLPIGTAIQNTAHIYFDFNPPVVTNTTVNTISEIQDTTIIGITPATQTFAINIYPNPANSQVTVTTGQAGHIIYMYTTQGKLVATQAMEGNATTLDIAMLPSGIYYIEVSGKLGTARKKLVKL